MNRAFLKLTVLLLTSVLMFRTTTVQAVVIAEDDAGNAPYADGWDIGDDGGTGFMPWDGLGPYGGGPMDIDNGPLSNNDLGSPAFHIGNGFSGFFVDRQFSTPMQVGDTFSMDFDTYPIFPDGGQILISFNNDDGDDTEDEPDERVALYAYYYDDGNEQHGTDFWGINAETANNNLAGGASLPSDPLGGIDFQTPYTTTDASDGFTLSLEIVTTDTYRLQITDDSVTKLDVSGQMYNVTAGELINQISIFGDMVTDNSFAQEVFFNNLQVTAPDAGPLGDFDGDGDVDGNDFLVWQRNPAVGNLSDWQANYGTPLTAAVTSVPEPASAGLMIVVLVGIFSSRSYRNP